MNKDSDDMYAVESSISTVAQERKPLLEVSANATAKNTLVRVGESVVTVPNPAYVEGLETKLKNLQEKIQRMERLFLQVRRLTEAHNHLIREINGVRAELDQKVDRID